CLKMLSQRRKLLEEAEEAPVRLLMRQLLLKPLMKPQLRLRKLKLLQLLKHLRPLQRRKMAVPRRQRLRKKIKKENKFHAFLFKYEEGLSFGSIPFFMFFSNY